MNPFEPYRVTLDVEVAGEARREIVDRVPREKAERIIRSWHRPRLLRLTRGVELIDAETGQLAHYRWRQVLEVRISPLREVVA